MAIRKRIRKYTVGNINSVKNWSGALAGVPCFIVGNAPSLTDLNLGPLEKFFTIGINRTFYKIDTTILLFQDIQLWHTDKHRVLKTNSIKYCRDRADIQGRFYHFRLTVGDYYLPEDATTLHGRGSSGPLAFQLAYVLGCDPIVLVGMDCCYKEDKTDFYGVNPHHSPQTLRNCVKGLKWIKDCNSERTIFNCSDNKVFPDEYNYSLEEVLKMMTNLEPMDRDTMMKKILYHNK